MNRKSIHLTVLLVGALVLAGLFVVRAAAQDPGFSETFDDVQLSGWEHSPEVIVSEGVLRIAPANFAARLGSWQNFDLGLRLRYSGPGETHVNYRASDSGSYLLRLAEEEVALLKTAPDVEPEELARSEGPALVSGAWMDVRIVLEGDEHTISIDDSVLLTASDPAEPLPPGTIAFASHGERRTEVDDVTLEVLAGEPDPGPAARETVPPAATPTPVAGPTSWQAFWEDLTAARSETLAWENWVVNLVLAVITSFILSRVYVYWGAALSNRRRFAANFMLITVTTTFIILVVRSSVALSLGLVGALSIIRFRAAIKDPEELAYLFFAISLGIGLGDNQRLVTLAALLVVILLIGLSRLLRQTQADVNLHLSVAGRAPAKVELPRVMDVLAKHCSRLRLLRFDETPEVIEMSFVVEFRHVADLDRARADLQALAPDLEISFLDNKGVW
ncbi:MAG: DUF4956 domain-containing protein [Chloroflexia bacterium]|nr:DUF4956 domain-containing protein [Chloroflexia bacterium]